MGNLRIPHKINSVSTYIKAIFDLHNSKISDYSESYCWFFRGQKNSSWSISPNVFRNGALKYEFDSIESAIRQRPYDFRECSTDLEFLTKLQHYGLGTRLLDVTLNPLVALYFASEKHEDFVLGKDRRGKYVPRDGKVVYKYDYGHKHSELGIRIACALPFIEFAEDFTLSCLLDELYNKKIVTSDERAILEAKNYENLINTIQNNYFVVSSHSNERLTKQNGAFIIPSAINIFGDELNVGNCLVRKSRCDLDDEFEKEYFIIPSYNKERIREELDFLNINEATLFPELEHQLVYLQNKKHSNPGQIENFEPFTRESTLSIDNIPKKDEIVPYSESYPNIQQIVNKYLTEVPDLVNPIINIIEQEMSEIDWWLKETTISRIKRNITRLLQIKLSRQNSKTLANNIVDEIMLLTINENN